MTTNKRMEAIAPGLVFCINIKHRTRFIHCVYMVASY